MTDGKAGDDVFVRLRRELHRGAELSGLEEATAARVRQALEPYRPDDLIPALGGHGLAACWRSERAGANVLLRCELDALPISDPSALAHASRTSGVAHKCGHDGHMAMLVGVAARLAAEPPDVGAVTLLFQPSEETGEGAERVLADPAFARVLPDVVLALHNLPGFPLGSVLIRDDVFAFGSVGAEIRFSGEESHAAEPASGNSPAVAVATMIHELQRMNPPGEPDSGAVTVTHVKVGEPAFGTSPGSGRVFATLRSGTSGGLAELQRAVGAAVDAAGRDYGLGAELFWREPFPVTEVDASVVAAVESRARELGLEVVRPPAPFRWSEDFGRFTARFPGALVGLGAGQDHPALHHPAYDFPDELIPIGADLLFGAARSLTTHPGARAGAGEAP